MVRLRHRKKIRKMISEIVQSIRNEKVSDLFKTIKEYHKLAEKIPEKEQEEYSKYFEKHMHHEIRMLDIEKRKIELNYKDVIFRTDQQTVKFSKRLSEEGLTKDMQEFYIKEYLNILKPQFILAQVLENYRKFLEIVRITKEEFNEWFFLKNIDFLKQLLAPFIVKSETKKKEEIWIHKKFEKELTDERKERMYAKVKEIARK